MRRAAGISFALMFVFAGIAAACGEGSDWYVITYGLGYLSIWVSIILFIISLFGKRKPKPEETFTAKERRKEVKRRRRANRRDMRMKVYEKEPGPESWIPVAAVLLNTEVESKKNTGKMISRGLAGGMLGGPAGAAFLLYTTKTKTKAVTATFSVEYENGKTFIETVKVDSARYNELARLAVRHERHP